MSPTLLFGVGAAKSGTSWLHEVLAAHPACHFRSIKELHYFDALEAGKLDRQRAEIRAARERLAGRLTEAPAERQDAIAALIADRADWEAVLGLGTEDREAYLGYLTAGAGAGDAKVVGDVTPAYALLPAARLRAMAALMPDVRFVYTMRDPVARLWSHVRMMAARRGRGGEVEPRHAARIFERTLAGKETEIERRGDYAARWIGSGRRSLRGAGSRWCSRIW